MFNLSLLYLYKTSLVHTQKLTFGITQLVHNLCFTKIRLIERIPEALLINVAHNSIMTNLEIQTETLATVCIHRQVLHDTYL